MTKTIETRNVTLAKLSIAEENARKTNVRDGLEQMMASIAAKGQLSPIIVYAGENRGEYKITGGQRRYLACVALQNEGKLPKNFAMRCEVNRRKSQRTNGDSV